MTKHRRKSLLERASKDQRSRRKPPVCRICSHSRYADIKRDLEEFHQLRKEGRAISFTWLVETHIPEEYGLRISRQSFLAHVQRHMKLGQ